MKSNPRFASSLGSLLFPVFLFSAVHPLAAQTIYTPYHFITIAGTAGVHGSADGVGSAARFYSPEGVAVDKSGNVYVTDTANNSIRKITPAVASGVTIWTVTTLAGAAEQISSPVAIQVDGGGNVNLGGTGNVYVQQTGAPEQIGEYLQITQAGVVTNLGSGGNYTAAVDANGNSYSGKDDDITENFTTGSTLGIAGGSFIVGSADGPGANATFYDTHNGGVGAKTLGPDVAVDASGNVYVADTYNNEIRKVTPSAGGGITTWSVTTLGGIAGVAGNSDGTGSAALFDTPFGIAADAKGNVYVADTSNDTIRMGYALVAPSFTLAASPATATVASGRTAVFNAIATGTPTPTYQWTLNGSTTIPGATVTNDPILVIAGATSGDAGTLTCTASNAVGTPATSSATLAVITTSNPGYLTNLSGRGVVGSGPANALFGGFGTSGTGTKNLLIRGMGPSTTMVGIPAGTELASTQLTLYDHLSAVITQNTDWAGNAAISTVEAAVGAYPVPANSLDSMLYVQEPVNAYSASVGGVGGATGIAVVELYDADTPPLASRLVNLSVRAPVGTGNNILFGGFSIGGTTDDAILVRAIGPSLAGPPSNLTGYLAQPILSVYQDGNATPLYSNTVWGGDPALVNAEGVVGAYPIATSSQDSLLLVSLPAGNYTAEITGVNYTTGIAVVEIYEVP